MGGWAKYLRAVDPAADTFDNLESGSLMKRQLTPISMNSQSYFTPETFGFFKRLSENNNRDWFAVHKQEYETLAKDPMLRFIADIDGPLKEISPRFSAVPKINGGSLFRIYRDTRYSKDKTPYKTWLAAKFFHEERRKISSPVFYLHMAPGEILVGGGLWHPPSEVLRRLRDFLVSNPRAWKLAVHNAEFRGSYELQGRSLKRYPRGFDPEHELIEDLRRQDFVAGITFDEAVCYEPDFMDRVLEVYAGLSPMMDYLCAALDLEYE